MRGSALKRMISIKAGDETSKEYQLFQATERYMKAFLMTKGIKVEMTHSLSSLLDQAIKYEPSWESIRETLEVAHK